jgi:alkanesulfonate monooxygenase SsuD/methylene tetrahydromethanopterin reductase-like flavin-dependent oxidoreductase (luciferase family)
MKFGLNYQLNVLRPLDKDQWGDDDEHKIFKEALEQIEFADKLGFDYIWETEHHFLEEYSASSAPEVFLAAVSQRTRHARLGHGIVQMPPRQNHPARVAERIATLDLISDGRVEFGTGEGATITETAGFGTPRPEKKEAWEEATRECVRMMTMVPYPGHEGIHFSMPERNIVPKPLQKPHPPLWVAASRLETAMVGARFGMGALGVGFESPQEAEERVTRYYDLIRGIRRPIGVAINPALATGANLMMGRTNEEAMARGLRGAQYFGFALAFTNGEVHHGRDHLHREFVRRFGPEGAERPPEPAPEKEPEDETQRTLLRAGGRGLFIGSPEFVRHNLRRYEDAHIDIMNFTIQFGQRRHEHIMETLEMFAKEVMPEFQERHHLHLKWREQQLDGVKLPINSSI